MKYAFADNSIILEKEFHMQRQGPASIVLFIKPIGWWNTILTLFRIRKPGIILIEVVSGNESKIIEIKRRGMPFKYEDRGALRLYEGPGIVRFCFNPKLSETWDIVMEMKELYN